MRPLAYLLLLCLQFGCAARPSLRGATRRAHAELHHLDRRMAYLQRQVQLLDQHGLAVAKANFDHDCTTLEIDGRPIPAAVIQAAKERKTVSDGQYVDPQGRIVSPFSFEAA